MYSHRLAAPCTSPRVLPKYGLEPLRSRRCAGRQLRPARCVVVVRGETPKLATHATALDTQTTRGAYTHRARTVEDLNDPARIGATAKSSVKVKDAGGNVSLNSYMTLPVEQYFVLDPSQIRFITGNRFELSVPRVNILNVWLEPVVEVTVQQVANRVVLQAENARIYGSDSIETLRLDERFCMKFMTELSWQPGHGGEPGSITGNAQLDVWSEVIPPFHLMPREVLVATCNAVMSGLVNSLLPLFLRKLGSDYEKWSGDETYRKQRAARIKPLA